MTDRPDIDYASICIRVEENWKPVYDLMTRGKFKDVMLQLLATRKACDDLESWILNNKAKQ